MLAQARQLRQPPQPLEKYQTQHQREHPQLGDGQRRLMLIGVEKADDVLCREPVTGAQLAEEMQAQALRGAA